jgi:hypothetical protein
MRILFCGAGDRVGEQFKEDAALFLSSDADFKEARTHDQRNRIIVIDAFRTIWDLDLCLS